MSKDNFLEKYITTMDEFQVVREMSRRLTINKDNRLVSDIIKHNISKVRNKLKVEASKTLHFKWCWFKYKIFKITLDKK